MAKGPLTGVSAGVTRAERENLEAALSLVHQIASKINEVCPLPTAWRPRRQCRLSCGLLCRAAETAAGGPGEAAGAAKAHSCQGLGQGAARRGGRRLAWLKGCARAQIGTLLQAGRSVVRSGEVLLWVRHAPQCAHAATQFSRPLPQTSVSKHGDRTKPQQVYLFSDSFIWLSLQVRAGAQRRGSCRAPSCSGVSLAPAQNKLKGMVELSSCTLAPHGSDARKPPCAQRMRAVLTRPFDAANSGPAALRVHGGSLTYHVRAEAGALQPVAQAPVGRVLLLTGAPPWLLPLARSPVVAAFLWRRCMTSRRAAMRTLRPFPHRCVPRLRRTAQRRDLHFALRWACAHSPKGRLEPGSPCP